MEEQKHNKITFIFGAGAEGKDYGLSCGNEFKKNILLCENVLQIYKLINNEDRLIPLKNGLLIRHNSSSTLYQTLKENESTFTDKFSGKTKRIINNYFNYKIGKCNKEEKKIYPKEFHNLFKTEIYNKLKNSNKTSYSKILDFYLNNLSFCSFVDSLFNYLRDTNNYPKECARVIKLYYSAFVSIISCLDENFLANTEKICADKDIMTNRKIIIEEIDEYIEKRKEKVEKEHKENGSAEEKQKPYYEILKEKISENKQNFPIRVITTNYTSICQKVLGLDDNYIAYVHGKLNLFENLKTKEIKDIREFNKDDIIFPYMMVQSGVKPVISPYQIKEWHKAIEFLENSEYIFVLGYSFKSDDEHFQTIIRDSINNKIMVFFLYVEEKNNDTQKTKNELESKFKSKAKNIYFFNTKEFEEIIKKVINNEKLISSI